MEPLLPGPLQASHFPEAGGGPAAATSGGDGRRDASAACQEDSSLRAWRDLSDNPGRCVANTVPDGGCDSAARTSAVGCSPSRRPDPSRGHFSLYTASTIYVGPGRPSEGVSPSMLFCPFRAGGFPVAEANARLSAWLEDPEVAVSWELAICGRRLICDCGLSDCHATILEGALTAAPRLLRPRSVWQQESMTLVQQVRQGQQVSHVLKQILENGAGGICEYSRLSQVKLPTPTPCWTASPKSVLRDLMPLPLPEMNAEVVGQSTLNDSCNAKNLSAARSAHRWATLLGTALNYLYVGGPALLHRPSRTSWISVRPPCRRRPSWGRGASVCQSLPELPWTPR